MVCAMNAIEPRTADADDQPGPAPDPNVPVLVAALYEEAPASLRQRLLNHLLRPVGPLALVAVAAGAFAQLLPQGRWSGVQVRLEDVLFRIRADHVLDLARYVEQKSPEMLRRLPEVLSASPLLMGTLSGALLLVALRARQRSNTGSATARSDG
jgi:predicted short-subunit dehydrogenase-like oxidoreductase (DUF2520 family)